jgi:hypothetical protein
MLEPSENKRLVAAASGPRITAKSEAEQRAISNDFLQMTPSLEALVSKKYPWPRETIYSIPEKLISA